MLGRTEQANKQSTGIAWLGENRRADFKVGGGITQEVVAILKECARGWTDDMRPELVAALQIDAPLPRLKAWLPGSREADRPGGGEQQPVCTYS